MSRELFYAYKETRLGLEPASAAAIVHAQVPSVGGATSSRRLTRLVGRAAADKNKSNTTNANANNTGAWTGDGNYTDEERAFRSKNLAVDAGIFHRQHHGAPRSFLWRVLEGGHVLSIRAVDVASPAPASTTTDGPADALLTLHLHFAKPVRRGCVAFADPAHADALSVFALDEHDYLQHVQVRCDIFRRKASANESDIGEAWAPHRSPNVSVHKPRLLAAVSATELVIALANGGVTIMRPGPGPGHAHDTTGSWHETYRGSAGVLVGLRSFMSLLPARGAHTVQHEGQTLDLTAAASAVTSTLGGDVPFLFTVCLDHQLRVWDLAEGDVVQAVDVLGQTHEAQEALGKWTVDAGQANLVRVVPVGEGEALVVAYSPVGAGAFKLWHATVVADADDSRTGTGSGKAKVVLTDVPEAPEPLQPPTPSAGDVWTLADFAVVYAAPRALSVWVLWKNNLVYRTMQLGTDLGTLVGAWAGPWVGVYADGGVPTAQTSGPCDPTDAAEKWLDTIFYPGRFSRATLETALAMYERGLGVGPAAEVRRGTGKSLMESICSVLGSTAALERGESGTHDYELFRSAGEVQWRRFYRLLVELDKQRGEALALAVDGALGLAWVVCTDCVAVARTCSALERVVHNGGGGDTDNDKVGRLLAAGAAFVDSFSDGMLQRSEAALRAELYGDGASRPDDERLHGLSDRAGFWRHLAEDECAQVVDVLGDNFERVDTGAYRALFGLLDDVVAAQLSTARDVQHPLTHVGQKLVLRGLQDTAALAWTVLFRQLILLVHMEFEVEDERVALRTRVAVGPVYAQLVDALRRLALVQWLSRTEFSVALSRSERASGSFSGSFSGTSISSGSGSTDDPTQVVTVLEGSVGHLLGVGALDSLASLLTDMMVDVCSAQSTIELDPAMMQCMLLQRGRADLAQQLGAFAADDPFATYVQGRVRLALRDYDTAGLLFQKAATGLSATTRHPHARHSAGLIDDAEWNLFYSGLPNYYAHIVALYDRHKAYSYVVDFARLSLQFVRSKASSVASYANGDVPTQSTQPATPSTSQSQHGLKGHLSRSHSLGGSDPVAEAASLSSTRTEMLSRLFTAAAALSRFDVAHSALISMGQPLVASVASVASAASAASASAGAGAGAGAATALQRSGLRYLVERMCETGQVAALLALPFPATLRDAVDDVLEHKCRAAMEVVRGTPWHYILYSWRVAHTDYRGAAAVLLDRLHKLQQAGEGDRFEVPNTDTDTDTDDLDTAVTRQYLMLINTLSCVEPKQAWIYTEDPLGAPARSAEPGPEPAAAQKNPMASFLTKAAAAQRPAWRTVVTLADLRRQYQAELDRIAAIHNNQFGFEADVSMA